MSAQLLSAADLSMAEVATALGYRDQSRLTRSFRRWHDEAPASWQARNTVRADAGHSATAAALLQPNGSIPRPGLSERNAGAEVRA